MRKIYRNNFYKRIIRLSILTYILLNVMTMSVLASTPYKTYTTDGYGRYVETQTAYEPVEAITQIGELRLSGASDMFITDDDIMYIADTNNARIIKATVQGELLQVIGEGDLSLPTGIYVTDDETLYVADELGGQVVVYDNRGNLTEIYTKPDHPLFGKTSTFQPQKLVVDNRGTMYIISKGNNNGIIQLSPSEGGTFLGYFGANDTRVSLMTLFRRMIFTDEQKDRMTKNQPATITNLTIDDRGLVYTVSQGEEGQTLKKLNIAGKNLIYPDVYDQYPSAVAIGQYGNIYVASKNGYIYEYNSEGDLMFVFGARDDGKQREGLFKTVTAIDFDSNNNLYVLDAEKNDIQVFQTTEFADLVHEGIGLYQDGLYTQSKEPWEQVLLMNSLFDYANQGMGHAYFREGDYDNALESYRLAKNKDGYSDAFWEVRNEWMKHNTGTLIIVLVLAYIAHLILKVLDKKKNIFEPVRRFKRYCTSKQLIRELLFLKYMLKNPADGYYGIRRENKVSYKSANILLILTFVIVEFEKYGSSYLFRTTREGRFEIVQDACSFFAIFFLLIIANYLVTTINDGEGRFRDVYQGAVYALAPYIIFKPILVAITHVLTYNEAFIISFGNFIIISWVLVMIVLLITYVNDFKLRETFKIILYTLFTVFIAILTMFIVYVLLLQVAEFIQSIFGEAVYRIASR